MYGIFTYIWVIYGVNVGKYSIHGSYGNDSDNYNNDTWYGDLGYLIMDHHIPVRIIMIVIIGI